MPSIHPSLCVFLYYMHRLLDMLDVIRARSLGRWGFTHGFLFFFFFVGPAGIIGAGRIGQVHLDTLASVPGVTPVIISDVVEPVLKSVTEKYSVPNYSLEVRA